MSKNDKLLPVPLKYTYPVVMEISPSNKPFSKLIYIPEEGKWILECNLLRFLKLRKIDLIVWKGRWLYKTIVDYGEDDWIDLKLKLEYPIVFRYTKEYLIDNLKRDPSFKCKSSIILKEDFIEQYEISRIGSKYKFNYSFDKLPKIINSRTEKVIIDVLEINPKTGKYYGEYKTSFEKFITLKHDYCKLSNSTKLSDSTKMSNQEFINKSKEKFGEDRFTYLTEYTNLYKEIVLKCNICGNIFKVTPFNHLYSKFGGCNKCDNINRRTPKSSINDFLERAKEKYGDLYNYDKIISENQFKGIKSHEKLDIYCNRCGKFFKQTAYDHVYGSGCPDCNKLGGKSALNVLKWLETNQIDYTREYSIKLNNRNIRIDYVFNYNNCCLWIEYNGLQHYKKVDYFHKTDEGFLKQLNRDNEVRKYCKENNIILIEIPYTYNTYEKVEQLLNRVILNGEDINSIIDYSKLYKI